MTDVDDALAMPGPRIFADEEIKVPRCCSRRDRISETWDAGESYPTPAEILVRLGALLLIFLWIASAADCLVDALDGGSEASRTGGLRSSRTAPTHEIPTVSPMLGGFTFIDE
jgi:hypothetical protein